MLTFDVMILFTVLLNSHTLMSREPLVHEKKKKTTKRDNKNRLA